MDVVPATFRPARAVVDSHHHLWDPGRNRAEWLDEPSLGSIRRRFDLSDLAAAVSGGLAGEPVWRTVVVQALPTAQESADLLADVADAPLVGAVVAWVDLERPDVHAQIAALLAGPAGERVRGFRHIVQAEPDPHWLLRPDVIRGLRAIAAHGLSYDLLVRPPQLDAAVALVEQLPELPIVLDHAGKPDLRSDGSGPAGWTHWASQVRRLAAHPQVRVKLSGLITEADWGTWTLRDLAPSMDTLFEAFGSRRVMFGSDWPVCLLAGSWQRWADTVAEFISPLTPDEQDDVLGRTAIDFYGGPGLVGEPIAPPESGTDIGPQKEMPSC